MILAELGDRHKGLNRYLYLRFSDQEPPHRAPDVGCCGSDQPPSNANDHVGFTGGYDAREAEA